MQILVFVSSHCSHCPKAINAVRNLAPQYADYGVTYRKIRAKTSEAKELSIKYNITVYPTILFLNDNKEILYTIKGAPSEDSLMKKIEQLLGMRKSFFSRIFGGNNES